VQLVPGRAHLVDDDGNVVGVRDANDNQDHLFVFAGEPTNSVAFDTTPDTTRPLGIGELRWNDTDGTLEFVLKGGNVTLQIGQEQVTLVKPLTGDLLEGKVVYIAGSDGGNKTAAYAQANGEVASSTTFGLMIETAAGGNKAFCTTFGMVRGIDTSALTEGAIVWLSPTVAGGMTTTKPTAPNHLVQIGYCVRSHANQGSVFVSVKNGYELEELHNVKITNPQDGQVLKYQASTGLWINATP
jgi:hypothetical protein